MAQQLQEALNRKHQFLRLRQVELQVGLKRSSIYQRIKDGDFPKSYPLGPRAVGWLAEDIDGWIESRIRASRKVVA